VLVGDGGVLTATTYVQVLSSPKSSQVEQVSQQFQILRFTTHVPLVNSASDLHVLAATSAKIPS
jgi:hypothetical protein